MAAASAPNAGTGSRCKECGHRKPIYFLATGCSLLESDSVAILGTRCSAAPRATASQICFSIFAHVMPLSKAVRRAKFLVILNWGHRRLPRFGFTITLDRRTKHFPNVLFFPCLFPRTSQNIVGTHGANAGVQERPCNFIFVLYFFYFRFGKRAWPVGVNN